MFFCFSLSLSLSLFLFLSPQAAKKLFLSHRRRHRKAHHPRHGDRPRVAYQTRPRPARVEEQQCHRRGQHELRRHDGQNADHKGPAGLRLCKLRGELGRGGGLRIPAGVLVAVVLVRDGGDARVLGVVLELLLLLRGRGGGGSVCVCSPLLVVSGRRKRGRRRALSLLLLFFAVVAWFHRRVGSVFFVFVFLKEVEGRALVFLILIF